MRCTNFKHSKKKALVVAVCSRYSDYVTIWTVRGSNPCMGKFRLLENIQTDSGVQPA